MSRREPVQKRSRERIEQILLAAADQLAKTGDANQLTTTSVSKGSGIPVATIYRYFADRMAIIATLIDRETEEIDASVVELLEGLETISLEILIETIVLAHLRHFQSSRRSIVLWFGARQSTRVLTRVDRRYTSMGAWVLNGAIAAGFVGPDVPSFGGELVVWFSDRSFEYAFREERTIEEENAIVREYLEMATSQIMKYATPEGIAGIPGEEFRAKAGRWELLGGEPDAQSQNGKTSA